MGAAGADYARERLTWSESRVASRTCTRRSSGQRSDYSCHGHPVAALTVIEDITPLVITYNEAPNIARTFDRLIWARRIVVIDSGSTDETLEIIRSYPQAEAISETFRRFRQPMEFWRSRR